MEKDADILAKYKAISNKLKKRFLKKPNVAEGSEQFASLANTLLRQDCPQYAGFCSLAQARCEHTLGNAPGEGHALTEAARAFLAAEKNCQDLLCPSFNEHLNAAINCYSHAIRVHIENKHTPLASALCLELGDALKSLSLPGEAVMHYQHAADLQSHNPLACLNALGLVASCKVDTNDFEGALSVFTEMSYLAQERGGGSDGKPLGAFCDIVARCEITRVLLLMLLKPTPQRIRPEHATTLEKYAWESTDETPSHNCINEELFLLLQSVVMACQSEELDCLRSLQVELWPMLSAEQNELLHLVIKDIERPAGI